MLRGLDGYRPAGPEVLVLQRVDRINTSSSSKESKGHLCGQHPTSFKNRR